jgi:putative transcriptional regulator
MTKTASPNRLTRALLETADDLRSGGLMGQAAHEKITVRHLGKTAVPSLHLLSGDEIRALREQANLSQAVFAQCLNLTTGYVSQLERGAKRPTGAALALLNVIQRHGMQAVL